MPPDSMPRIVSFTVPLLPPSVNHYWTGQGKWTRVSPAGKAFKASVAIFCRGQSVIPACTPYRLKSVRYSVTAKVVFGKKMKGDIDNMGKGLFDGLKDAGVIHSDDRVMEIHLYKDLDERPNDSRTEITVELL